MVKELMHDPIFLALGLWLRNVKVLLLALGLAYQKALCSAPCVAICVAVLQKLRSRGLLSLPPKLSQKCPERLTT